MSAGILLRPEDTVFLWSLLASHLKRGPSTVIHKPHLWVEVEIECLIFVSDVIFQLFSTLW